jgi:hypothetical protein
MYERCNSRRNGQLTDSHESAHDPDVEEMAGGDVSVGEHTVPAAESVPPRWMCHRRSGESMGQRPIRPVENPTMANIGVMIRDDGMAPDQ